MFGRFRVMSLKIPENWTELIKNIRKAAIVSAASANLLKPVEILTAHPTGSSFQSWKTFGDSSKWLLMLSEYENWRFSWKGSPFVSKGTLPV